MKRNHDQQSADPTHPSISFHREVLIVQQWAAVRQAFLLALQAPEHKIEWREPSKLWRHSQEALGKWILSQVARVKNSDDIARLHFFPTRDMVQRFDGAKPYDAQLIRDLSLKSSGATDASVARRIEKLVQEFDLAERCHAAHTVVEEGIASLLTTSSTHGGDVELLRPRLRRVEEGDASRTPAQRRVQGPIAEVSVSWPSHWPRGRTRNCAAASIPWAAWEKLQRSYHHFGLTGDLQEGYVHMHSDRKSMTHEELALLRSAVVVLRYEGGLATGSLQLCADTALKQHLHARGYHVMDLCASPINAYMGVPQVGVFNAAPPTAAAVASAESGTARPSSLDGERERPNNFCSAFTDTDAYFGSLGSALRVDPMAMYASSSINADAKPLLLTLDVPYDEDLCELLFDKLRVDMQRATAGSATTTPCRVDYVLVLPLWWRVPMQIEKSIFLDDHTIGREEQQTRLESLLKERCAVFDEGFQVPYHWPENLSAAAGPAHTDGAWVTFDGVFIGNRYSYFCTATNRWLQGVTTTEVIGLAQPRAEAEGGKMLLRALEEFYPQHK